MREVWTLDSETDPFKKGRIPKPFIWGLYTGSEYLEFFNTETLIKYLSTKNVIVYAHNGGKFDYFFLLDYLTPFSEITVINGRMAKFKIGECEFRDSYNILPIPLSAYQKDEIDYSIMEATERQKPENKKKISDYLRGDCVYLHKLTTTFIENYGLNLTLATSALKAWQFIENKEPPKTSQQFYNQFKPYYYGGRVECFEHGIFEENFSIIDINSAYPFAMTHFHPYGDTPETFEALPDTDDEISRSFIHCYAKGLGAFPRREKDGSLEFPNDGMIYEFFITGWEYLAARDTDTLKAFKLIDCIIFNEKINFIKYVEHFFALKNESKQKGDKEQYIFSKLFLNSLYGKFAANPDKYNEFKIVEPQFINAAGKEGYEFSAELGKWALVQRALPDSKRHFYNVAVGASITGFVRAYLWKNINNCKGVMYCDTDSIVCRSYNNSILGDALGRFSFEGLAVRGAIAGKKLYAFKLENGKYKSATKGTKLKPIEVFKIAKGEEIIFEPENPTFSLTNGVKFVNRKVRQTVKKT